MNKLIRITHNTTTDQLAALNTKPSTLYLLFIPNRFTTPKDYKHVQTLVSQLDLPPENYIEINIKSIVQKTWRIIKHYQLSPHLNKGETSGESQIEGGKAIKNRALPKGTPDRSEFNTSLQQQNTLRIEAIQKSIEEMIIQDQATRLNAEVVVLN